MRANIPRTVLRRLRLAVLDLLRVGKTFVGTNFLRVPAARVTRTRDRRLHGWDGLVDFHGILDPAHCVQSEVPYDPGLYAPHHFWKKELLVLQNAVFDASAGGLYLKQVGVAESTPWRAARVLRRSAIQFAFVEQVESEGPVFFVSQRQWNYYHWLVEDLPALLFAGARFGNLQVYVGHDAPTFVDQSLAYYKIPYSLCKGLVSAERTVLVTRGPNDTGWPHRWDVKQLRGLDHNEVVGRRPSWRKIYVSRRFSKRSPAYERGLETALQAFGLEVLFLEDMSFEAQKEAFFQASLVISPHGAGLANLVFCPTGTWVIELLGEAQVNQCYERLSQLCGLHYAALRYREDSKSDEIFRQLEGIMALAARDFVPGQGIG